MRLSNCYFRFDQQNLGSQWFVYLSFSEMIDFNNYSFFDLIFVGHWDFCD